MTDDPTLRDECDVLTERIITMGLIIESSSYAVTSGMQALQGFVTGSRNCFERCDSRFVDNQLVDLIFNDPRFLSDATDIGVN